jgi:purine-binding chemotaxis protein CheW
MRCLSFFTDNEFFAVDVTLVQKVARKMTVTPVPTAPDAVEGITNIKGRVVTLLNLCELLGRKKKHARGPDADEVDAVIFKSFSGGDDQIGLVIDKPGNLIDIDDNTISLPSLTTGAEESFCISGIAEVDNMFYRIISIDSIMEKYKYAGEKAANTILNKGDESDE